MRNIFSSILYRANYFNLVRTTSQLLFSISAIFRVRRTAPVQTDFNSMVTQLNLNENDLIKRIKYFEKLLWFWLFILSMVCVYGFYLISKGVWLGVISTAVLATIVLSQVFRYDFWLFQIRQRKLGCSFQEWFHAYLGKDK